MKPVALAMRVQLWRPMKLFAWGQTDVGSKRDHNEDSFLVAIDLGLFVIADGMGGHQGGDRAYLGHVGDSRAYLYRDGKVSQLTEDHSWIREQVKAGLLTPEDARDSKFKHIITRSVGFERDVMVDLQQVPVTTGDCFLLC